MSLLPDKTWALQPKRLELKYKGLKVKLKLHNCSKLNFQVQVALATFLVHCPVR